jgi:hypothetical protein
VHDVGPSDVVDVELPATVVEVVEVVEVVDVVDVVDVVEVVVRTVVVVVPRTVVVVVVVPRRRRTGRTNASATTASGFRTCTAAQRARAPETCPHTARVWIGTHSGPPECAEAPPSVLASTTAPTANTTATVATRTLRDLETDIGHPTRQTNSTTSYRPLPPPL